MNKNKIIEILKNNTSNNQIITIGNYNKIANEILFKSKDDLKAELYSKVSNWVDSTFNQINIDVIKHTLTVTEEYIEDLIESVSIDFEEYINDNSKKDEYKEYLDQEGYDNTDYDNEELQEQFCEQDDDFQEYKDSLNDNNYPMWNTCFETKNSSWSSLTEAAKKVGCGIINESEYFSDIIFMTSCGHSFYSAYWIPMYLEIFDNERELYKNIDYSDL